MFPLYISPGMIRKGMNNDPAKKSLLYLQSHTIENMVVFVHSFPS